MFDVGGMAWKPLILFLMPGYPKSPLRKYEQLLLPPVRRGRDERQTASFAQVPTIGGEEAPGRRRRIPFE